VISSRTVARLGSAVTPKHTRWNTIVREAAEQSGRGGLPTVAPAINFADAVVDARGARLLPWEEAKSKRGLLSALGQTLAPVESVSILIGPEGGLEASEVEQAVAAGWQVVSLGKRILRAETAAMAALTLVALAIGDLGDTAMAQSTPAKSSELVLKKNAGETQKDDTPAAPAQAKAEKPESAKRERAKAESGKATTASTTRRKPADSGATVCKTPVSKTPGKAAAAKTTESKAVSARRKVTIRKGVSKPSAKE
jgi:hypothetical protein